MRLKSLVVSFLVLVLLLGCSKAEKKKSNEQLPKGTHKVTVIEFQNVPSYTYIKVSENGKDYWIAVSTMNVKKGETLYFRQAIQMNNFESTTLKKTFKKILFVQDASKILLPEKVVIPKEHQISPVAAHTKDKKTNNIKLVKIKKGKSELTIAQLYKTKDKLNGKTVTFKGKVIKFNANIMGKNWAHLEDGTKMDGNVDITITLQEQLTLGQVVTIKGVVKTNTDYGYGYSYPVMIQDAKIVK